jgi:tetratricopeptide (TPR) repeat protein
MPTLSIGGAEVLRRRAQNPDAAWPTEPHARDRIHPIALARIDAPFRCPPDASVVAIGDGFARQLAEALGARRHPLPAVDRLDARGPGMPVEPELCSLPTPTAMVTALSHALTPSARGGVDDGFVQVDAGTAGTGVRWADPLSAPARPTTLATVRARRLRLDWVLAAVTEADLVILAPQSAEAWWDSALGRYINAPDEAVLKADPTRFALHLLDAHDVRQALDAARERIRLARRGRASGDVNFAVAVSPRPMAETYTADDVLIANERSKSVLVAGAHAFADGHADIVYLPTLETVARSAHAAAFAPDGRTVAPRMMGVLGERISAALSPEGAPLGRAADPVQVPTRGQVLHQHAAALVARVQDDTVAQALKAASRANPDAYGLHMRLARRFLKDGQTADAIEVLRDAVAAAHATADIVETQLELGRALCRIGHDADAEDAFRAACDLRPGDGAVRLELGRALARLDRPAEAEAELRRACDLMPDDAEAHLALGRLLRDRGRAEDAADALSRATALAPQLAEAQNELGQVLLGMRRHAPALAALRRAAELDPRFANTRSAG